MWRIYFFFLFSDSATFTGPYYVEVPAFSRDECEAVLTKVTEHISGEAKTNTDEEFEIDAKCYPVGEYPA